MDERFTPRMYVEYYARVRDIAVEAIGVAPTAVITWSPSVVQWAAEATGALPCPNWIYKDRYAFVTGEVGGRQVSFAQAPVGAPGTVTMMEEMIACGAQTILGLGWAGSLQPRAAIGACLIPTGCIREEGTSPHYLAEIDGLGPDAGLASALEAAAKSEGLPVWTGLQWTTDAPYRELLSKIEAYQQRGALGVDMETSAMYALGAFRGVRVCNLLVVSDELWQEWNPAFRTPELRAATRRALEVVLRVLMEG